MFSGLMVNTWAVATAVAVVAGVTGFFVVVRGSAFAAHALPNGAFAGAAGAALVGASTLLGLGVFSVAGAVGIAVLGRRGRTDVATALGVVTLLATGALFLTLNSGYADATYGLLFGQILGVSTSDVVVTAALGAASLVVLAAVYRPLLLSSLVPDVGAARGISPMLIETVFLVIVALITTMAVPVVGALLIFSLLVAPAAAARQWTSRPGPAIVLSVALALGTVWTAIAVSFSADLPVGFVVGSIGAVLYGVSAARRAPARRYGSG